MHRTMLRNLRPSIGSHKNKTIKEIYNAIEPNSWNNIMRNPVPVAFNRKNPDQGNVRQRSKNKYGHTVDGLSEVAAKKVYFCFDVKNSSKLWLSTNGKPMGKQESSSWKITKTTKI